MTTWIIYDKKQTDLKEVRAETWREAVKKAMELGVKPRRHIDVRPRQGIPDNAAVTKQDFKEFMS